MILILLSLIVGLCGWIIILNSKRHASSPPGPFPWPIIGNLVQVGSASQNPIWAISNLSKIYGPIYSLRLGSKDLVIIASRALMESISLNENLLGRDLTGMFYDRALKGKNLGVVTATGETWRKNRSWTFSKLKDLGLGKTHAVEYFVMEETQKLFERVESSPENIMVSESLMGVHLMSISYQVINSRQLTNVDRERIRLLTEKAHLFTSSGVFGAGLASSFPAIRHVLPGLTGKTIYDESFAAMNSISGELIEEALKRVQADEASDSSFSDLYAEMIIAEKDLQDSLFSKESFQLTFQDIIIASTDTTNGVLQNAIFQLSLNKDIQGKVYREVKNTGDIIVFEDMKRMPYVQAVIHESMRTVNVVPNLIPRKATKDFIFEGYLIKEGTVVMADMNYCYTNENIWKNASEFNPERFLDSNGNFVAPKELIPFGTGPRRCPGDVHGMMSVFLFLTQIVQKYVVSIPSGDPEPRTDMAPGFTLKPYNYRCQFTKRRM